jgi:hypothetical protein
MTAKPFQYNAITSDSNFAPISLELRDGRTSEPLNLSGAAVAVRVVDQQTGEVVVEAGVGSVNTTNPAWVEYYFAAPEVAKIERKGMWLVQWTVTAANGRVYKNPIPCLLPVEQSL